MDWITQEYVKAEAEKGRKQAIECAQLHWRQLVKAGPEELEKALSGRVEISNDYCAMCQRYYDFGCYDISKKCRKCHLKCNNIWQYACNALDEWIDNPTRAHWRKWKVAAKAMLAKIDRLHERLYRSKP